MGSFRVFATLLVLACVGGAERVVNGVDAPEEGPEYDAWKRQHISHPSRSAFCFALLCFVLFCFVLFCLCFFFSLFSLSLCSCCVRTRRFARNFLSMTRPHTRRSHTWKSFFFFLFFFFFFFFF